MQHQDMFMHRVVTDWELRAAELAADARGWMQLYNGARDEVVAAHEDAAMLLEEREAQHLVALRAGEEREAQHLVALQDARQLLEQGNAQHQLELETLRQAHAVALLEADKRRKTEKRALAAELKTKADERVAAVEKAMTVALLVAQQEHKGVVETLARETAKLATTEKQLQCKTSELEQRCAAYDKLNNRHREYFDDNRELRLKLGELELLKDDLEAELDASERHYAELAQTSRNAGALLQEQKQIAAVNQKAATQLDNQLVAMQAAFSILAAAVDNDELVGRILTASKQAAQQKTTAGNSKHNSAGPSSSSNNKKKKVLK